MFDIGWSELLLIGIVALIVIGPKDLPGMFHTLGRFTARARSMAREFSKAMEQAAKESGVNDIAKDINTISNPKSAALHRFKDAATKFESWDPLKGDDKPKADAQAAAKMGPNTQALSKDRAAMADKIRSTAAAKASDRIAAEKAAAAPKKPAAKAPPKKPAAKAPAKKPAAKAPAKKSAAKKPAAKAQPAKQAAKPRAKPAAGKATG